MKWGIRGCRACRKGARAEDADRFTAADGIHLSASIYRKRLLRKVADRVDVYLK
jgi:hypothetical protein